MIILLTFRMLKMYKKLKKKQFLLQKMQFLEKREN